MTYTKEQLKSELANNFGQVTFTKTNGEERIIKCTLLKEELPKQAQDEIIPSREDNPDILAVWDLEAKDWRSFRIKSVKKVKFLEAN